MQIRFMGSRRVIFEDEGGVEILEYDTDTVHVGAGGKRVRLFGSGFSLGKITPEIVMVCGDIHSLEFDE